MFDVCQTFRFKLLWNFGPETKLLKWSNFFYVEALFININFVRMKTFPYTLFLAAKISIVYRYAFLLGDVEFEIYLAVMCFIIVD